MCNRFEFVFTIVFSFFFCTIESQYPTRETLFDFGRELLKIVNEKKNIYMWKDSLYFYMKIFHQKCRNQRVEKKNRKFNEHASFQREQRVIFTIIACCHLEK